MAALRLPAPPAARWVAMPPHSLPPPSPLLLTRGGSIPHAGGGELILLSRVPVPPVVVRNDEWTWQDVLNRVYKERAFDNIVISPGPGSPACPSDIGICLRILSECGDIPILGVCLGHQALGFVHGAKCSSNGGELSNSDSESGSCRVIMGIRHSSRPHYGVQFHPESVATHYGRQILQNFKKMTSDFGLRSLWLDERKNRARFSFMGGKGGSLWKQITFHLLGQRANCGGTLVIRDADGSTAKSFIKEGFLEFLDEENESIQHNEEDYEGLPFDFHGGYVGYLGLNQVLPMHAYSSPIIVVVDHNNGDVYILSLHDEYSSQNGNGIGRNSTHNSWLMETEKRLLRLASMGSGLRINGKAFVRSPDASKQSFVVEKSKDQAPMGSGLRINGNTLVRSPDANISTVPARYYAANVFLFYMLTVNSEKDQAENLMIVDLLRNDLGKVCEPGSVHVPRLMDVESYKTVHTMVSTVRGTKKLNLSPVDCVKAAFPGGSMTGAPKVRSMEILDSLENSSRGVYSGSIGFFSYNRTFDLNIVIRTVVLHNGEASVGAGGAIVAMSDPEAEYNEMMLKAKAPTKVVEDWNQAIYDSDRLDSMQTTIS
ncbi:hypothetical protein PR202_gb28322 [Eleusine coracana subsp. coracana]|uniref:aminodeoxychorismate synthase n=1 Tax=Eleusine coracana subsp. coracana TaxID=191504 RepID=A0AAV5FWS0_ELECO|nr:hypothetical protein PR202_gb28322 [Eleusine coracana subsp. coracana]